MLSGTALQKTGNGWQFSSEVALEDFVWNNLNLLLRLTPLKRQYIVNGEICDIVAVSADKQLTILELKNQEDRYIVQQLTRYYENLLEEKPFSEQIDYDKPVRLIAIAPSYHRHNLIDRKHCRLQLDFLQTAVSKENETFYLTLNSIETNQAWQAEIPFREINFSAIDPNISEPPKLLIDWLGTCTKAEQEGILKVRTKMLSFHPKLREIVEAKTISYGAGKTKLCAEIIFERRTQRPVLFLWLPTPSTYQVPVWDAEQPNTVAYIMKPTIGRLRIWMDGQSISHIGHIPEGFGKMRLESEWRSLPKEKQPRLKHSISYKSHIPIEIEGYLKCRGTQQKPDFWEVLTDLALEYWLKRL